MEEWRSGGVEECKLVQCTEVPSGKPICKQSPNNSVITMDVDYLDELIGGLYEFIIIGKYDKRHQTSSKIW